MQLFMKNYFLLKLNCLENRNCFFKFFANYLVFHLSICGNSKCGHSKKTKISDKK